MPEPLRCAVVGAGPMGTATAAALLADGHRVLLVDRDAARLAGAPATDRHHGDITDPATIDALAGCDAVAAALSWADTRPLIALAHRAPVRLVTIGRPPPEHADEIGSLAPGSSVVVGAGLEPGLTEILAHRLAVAAGPDADLRLYCGGVPERPRPPMRHLSWYGTGLTISPRPTFRIVDGKLERVERFSGVELVDVPGLGVLEAFHDGLAPWIADDPVLGSVRQMDQKTLRWPGYAARVAALAELGLLDDVPLSTVDGPVRPRAVLDAVLAPHVTPRPGDTDVTVLVAEATGPLGTYATVVRAGTDPATGTTGMGRLTGAALALAASRAVRAPDGVVYAHELFAGGDAVLVRLRRDGITVREYRRAWVRRSFTDHAFEHAFEHGHE
jgi:lysine 6-dehydrogenase